jgi:heme-degrading monooxygenase HmoA
MTTGRFAETPQPPYYAVIFTSQRAEHDPEYERAAERMVELASEVPGFIGVESARGADGLGITVSYWRDEAAIRLWRENAAHIAARKQGREAWYEHFEVRIAKVERAYGLAQSAFAKPRAEQSA